MTDKSCTICTVTKSIESFRSGRNQCKDCDNQKSKTKMKELRSNNSKALKKCLFCDLDKPKKDFTFGQDVCNSCLISLQSAFPDRSCVTSVALFGKK